MKAPLGLGPLAAPVVVLCTALGGCYLHETAVGDLSVVVDPTLDTSGASHVGENRDQPKAGEVTTVEAKREVDGTLVVDVGLLYEKYQCGPSASQTAQCRVASRLWLNETPAGWSAKARCCSESVGSSLRWPFETMRGTVRVNHSLRELSSSPLVVDMKCTGLCAGSDQTCERRFVVTDADLR
jgi:hypothetical protein